MDTTASSKRVSQETFCRFCRLLYERHLVTGIGGNVAARMGKHILVTPSGVSLREIHPNTVVTVNEGGEILSGDAPTKDIQMHLGILKVRADVNIVCHVHGAFVIAASAMLTLGPDALPPLTPGFVFYAHPLPMLPFMLPGSAMLAQRVVEEFTPGDRSALLLQSHGLVTAGNDFSHAINVAEEIEEAARIWVLTGGKAKAIPQEHVKRIRGGIL